MKLDISRGPIKEERTKIRAEEVAGDTQQRKGEKCQRRKKKAKRSHGESSWTDHNRKSPHKM